MYILNEVCYPTSVGTIYFFYNSVIISREHLKSSAICKSQNGESGNRIMGTRGIRLRPWGIKARRRGIRVGGGMRGIEIQKKVYKIQFYFFPEIKKKKTKLELS